MMPQPKYKVGETIQIRNSPYSFKVEEILVEGIGMYRYRGQMFKDRRLYKYGTVTERVLVNG